jgi:hypothetical protein
MKYVKPAWFFETSIEQEHNLFSISNIENNYKSYVYVCHCRKTNTLIDDSIKDYKCSCGNSNFLNIDEAKLDFNKFTSYYYFNKKIRIEFEYNYKIDILNNKVQAICFIKIPIQIDKKNNKLKYEEIVIASAVPNKTNKVDKVPKEYSKEIEIKLKNMIVKVEEFEKFIEIKLSRNGSKVRQKEIYFFLNHINLKEKEFINWKNADLLVGENLTIQAALIELTNNKKYKSVKKAIFRNYQVQIQSSNTFNPLLNYLATSKIDDPNFIVELIDMEYINNDKYLTNLDKTLFLEFSDFLIRNYSNKQVIHFFKNFDNFIKIDNNNFNRAYLVFQDILRQYHILKFNLDKEFEKVGCTPRKIHDQFAKIINARKYKYLLDKKLTYSTRELKAQIKIDDYIVKLPHNGAELHSWANTLHNCMASYLSEIENKQTVIYGFFIEDKIVFAVEIRNEQILQAYRAYNRNLMPNEQSVLSQWFENFYLN